MKNNNFQKTKIKNLNTQFVISLFSIILLFILASSFASAVIVESDILVAYRFEEASNVNQMNSKTNLSDMIVVTTVNNVSGFIGSGKNSAGTVITRSASDHSKNTTINTLRLNGTQNVSFTFAVNPDGLEGTGDGQTIWTTHDNSKGSGYMVHQASISDSSGGFCYATGTTAGAWEMLCIDKGNIPIGIWTQVTFTYDGSSGNKSIYINNTFTTSGLRGTTAGNAYAVNNGFLGFWTNKDGGSPATYSRYSGSLDEFVVFNKTLTSTEVTFIKNNSYPYSVSSLPATNDSFIVFQGQTPNNNTIQYFYTNNNLTIQTNASFFGGIVNTTIYLYNSTGLYRTASNITTNQVALFNTTFTGLPIETYRFNATATNGSRTNITNQITFSIYNITSGEFSNPATEGQQVHTNINITWSAGNNTLNLSSINVTYYNITIKNSTGNVIININTTSTYYNWNTLLAEYRMGNYNITLTSNFNNNISLIKNSYVYLNTTAYLKIYAYNIDNTLISDVTITINTTGDVSNSNPGIFVKTNEYNTSGTYNQTLLITVADNDLFHYTNSTNITINRFTEEINITLQKVYLRLNFTRGGGLYNASGIITDSLPKSSRFENNSIVIGQQDVALGKVQVYFGSNATGNWTQYYEYINDKSEIRDQLEVLINPDWYHYFKIYSLSRVPIQDVVIRMTCSNNTVALPNWENNTLVGQRLTEDDGLTFFWLKFGKTCQYTITKTGFNSETGSFIVGDEDRSITNPLIIYLTPTTNSIIDGTVMVGLPPWTFDKSSSIAIQIFAPGIDLIEINNSQRIALGIGAKTIQDNECDVNSLCNTRLYSGTDYLSNNQNVSFDLFIDGTYYKTYTIYDFYLTKNISATARNITIADPSQLTNVEPEVRKTILWIGIILLSGMIGFLFKNSEWTPTILKFGIVIIALIEPTFIWVVAIIGIGLVLKLGVKRILNE